MQAKTIAPIWPRLMGIADRLDAPVILAGRAVSWLYLPLILIILIDAVSRKFIRKLPLAVEYELHEFFNSPVFQDAEWRLHTVIFLGALGFTYARNAHVRLDMFRARFGARGRLWIEFLGGILLLTPFLLIFSIYSWEFFLAAWGHNEGSGASTGLGNRWFIPLSLQNPKLLVCNDTEVV
jgi:TRAP-type mannitol/chloroaromatic compound transport system permease small subunit